MIVVDCGLDRIFIRSSSGGRDLLRLEHCVDDRNLLRSKAPSGRSRSYAISIRGTRTSPHLGDAWTSLECPISIKSRAPLDGQDNLRKNSTIAVRSNGDRGAIEPRSWIFRRGIISTSIKWDSLRIEITICSRSWSNSKSVDSAFSGFLFSSAFRG